MNTTVVCLTCNVEGVTLLFAKLAVTLHVTPFTLHSVSLTNEARPGRLERPTYRFEACRSIQLSYGRVVPPSVWPANGGPKVSSHLRRLRRRRSRDRWRFPRKGKRGVPCLRRPFDCAQDGVPSEIEGRRARRGRQAFPHPALSLKETWSSCDPEG